MYDMKWKTLRSEYLFNDEWFTVRKDICERPDGKRVEPYYVYEFPTWVTALAFTKDGKVIIEKQYRHALGETSFELPGGCVDDTDANLEEAIARELMEETGYQFASYEYVGKTCANPSTHNNWIHCFIARDGEFVKEQTLDDNEDIDVHLITLEELKEKLFNGEIVQSMHVTACIYAFRKLGLL